MSRAHNAEAAARWCLLLAAGELSPAQQQALQRWLQEDAEHPRLFARAQRTWDMTGAAAAHPRVQALRHAARADLQRARRRPSVAWAAAAALALAAIGTWWGLAPTVYRTGLAQQRQVVLDDGSALALDADSRVEVRYSGRLREVRLRRGRAAFSVAKQHERPFVVEAGASRVVATGTAFSVERVGEQVRVVLYEGSVRIEDRDRHAAAAAPAPQRLAAGQAWTSAAPGTTRPRVVRVEPAQEQAWRDGLLLFDDEPLAIAVARVNRYSPVQLQLADRSVGQLRVSGMFKAGDSAAFASGVTAVLPLRARTDAAGAIVLEAR
ncbi:FecR domain-containing protein [Xanthomonas sp. AM6]|uniref:FecR family protein n=1 Tax=Xanthomonas sp. AM6 TaxID=2982531 RepID=UPI0021D8C8D0|nr:FecR domain-containing protein [Xanthomonas sp. AM6]UYB52602.1 FecR domain-containing protein [Xanthomonas sp. AM6]